MFNWSVDFWKCLVTLHRIVCTALCIALLGCISGGGWRTRGGGLPSPPRRFDDGGSQMHLPSCGPTWLARVSLDHNKDADHDHGDDDGKDEQWRVFLCFCHNATLFHKRGIKQDFNQYSNSLLNISLTLVWIELTRTSIY